MKTQNLFKTLLIWACLLGAGWAWGQEYPQHIRDLLSKAQGNERSIELKDGRVLTYRELALMPEELRKETRGLVVSRGKYASFQDWVQAVINANTEETEQRVAAIKAKGEVLDQQNAALIVRIVPMLELLANTIRTHYRAGEHPSFPISRVHRTFQDLKLQRQEYMKAGLKEETYKLFESLAELRDWPKKLDERP